MRGPYLFPALQSQVVTALRVCDPAVTSPAKPMHFGAIALQCERHALLCYYPERYLLYQKTELRFHYRIGTAIADVADKALQPADPAHRLRANCNYREDEQQSRARLTEFANRDEQFAAMYKSIARQLRTYPRASSLPMLPPDSNTICFASPATVTRSDTRMSA